MLLSWLQLRQQRQPLHGQGGFRSASRPVSDLLFTDDQGMSITPKVSLICIYIYTQTTYVYISMDRLIHIYQYIHMYIYICIHVIPSDFLGVGMESHVGLCHQQYLQIPSAAILRIQPRVMAGLLPRSLSLQAGPWSFRRRAG